MRARSLKPSLFRNELLAVADPLYTLVFQGLWCLADRAGRLEDRPAKIHLEINPGRAFETTAAALSWLADQGFIERYQVADAKFIQVVNFTKHQNPHVREPESTIPAQCKHDAGPVLALLTPDSGLLTPDSPLPRSGARPVELHDSLPKTEWDEWIEFRRQKRWPNDPTTLRKQLKLLARFTTDQQREMLDTSIQAGWQGLFAPKSNGKAQLPAPAKRPPPTPEEITAAQRAAAEANKRELARKLNLPA